MPVKIRHLKVLDAAVRLGSFVEAAGALHLTPAALSLAMRELEEALGFRVLQRTTRRLELTQAGAGYLVHARRVLAELEAADRYARDYHRGRSLVRLATTQTVIATLLSQTLPELQAAFPQIQLQPLDVAASGIVDALVQGQADMAIGVSLPNGERFESRPLFRSRWFAYMAPDHRLARRRALGWSDIADQRLYMTKSANYLRLRATLGKAIDLADVQESTTATAGLAMASSGTGIAVFPGYVQPMARVLGVQGVPITRPAVPHELLIGVPRPAATDAAPLAGLRDAIVQLVNARCEGLR
ncbi:MAG: LysR family transcriptional regulator [Rhodoferax sp.]